MGVKAETLPDGKSWRLLESFKYDVISVPKNFIFDFASIPKFAWSFIGGPASGKYRDAAVVHDYCYFKQDYTRSVCDRIFKKQMKDLDVPWWKRTVIWVSVRLFGWIPWKSKGGD